MAFDKAYLKLKNNNPRGIPDEYTYWGRDDTIAEITATGYFDESAFAPKEDPRRNLTDPPDTDAYAIHVQASDGPYEVQLVGGVASVVGGITKNEKTALISAIGDSRLANSFVDLSSGGVSNLRNTTQGMITWLCYFLNQRCSMPIEYDLAVSGSTTEEIAGQADGVLQLNPKPKICIINGLTNDVPTTLSEVDSALSNITGAALKLKNQGVIPVIETDTPRTEASWSAASSLMSTAYNRKLREWCRVNGVLLSDHEAKYVNPATGEPQTGYNVADGIHQSTLGGMVRASVMADVLSPIVADFNLSLGSPIDIFDSTLNPQGNILTSGLMTGTGGTNTGSGASGAVSDGWQNRVLSGTMTAVASKESPRQDGKLGDKLVVDLSATTAGSYRLSPSAISTSELSDGDEIVASLDLDIVSLSGQVDTLEVSLFDFSGSVIGSQSLALKNTFGTGLNPFPELPIANNTGSGNLLSGLSGRVTTEKITIGQGITSSVMYLRIEAALSAGASMQIKLGDVQIRKIN